MVMSTCDGDATGKGICVRDALGKWQTYQPPSPQGLLLPFPGEVLFFSETPDGALELRNVGKNESHVFLPAEVTSMRARCTISPARCVATTAAWWARGRASAGRSKLSTATQGFRPAA